ncbi:MAG: type 1 glutamine amidotransferase [Rhodobacteraceae bacterium]|nr:MAG: type 1 glutamine amidotransferase [Paracoccaceae bacterium]
MHLAILVTNTDESAFAQRHPKDGEKFPAMLHAVRPDWRFSVWQVKDGDFPATLAGLDGAILTGSPASVHDDAPWIARLMDLIREMDARGLPMFGACFGHQAIALALGGAVGRNPNGYVHGLTHSRLTHRAPWMSDLPDPLRLYGSHVEQVTRLPEGTWPVASSEDCPIAGFVKEARIFTTQHHPEMTPGFIAALTDEMADYLGPDVTARARASLGEPADSLAFATSVARFFEAASSPGS